MIKRAIKDQVKVDGFFGAYWDNLRYELMISRGIAFKNKMLGRFVRVSLIILYM